MECENDNSSAKVTSQNYCQVCQGDGRIPVVNRWAIDRGTKWQRNYEETILEECPECDGTGVDNEDGEE